LAGSCIIETGSKNRGLIKCGLIVINTVKMKKGFQVSFHSLRAFLKSHWYTAILYLPIRNFAIAYLQRKHSRELRENFKLHGLEIVEIVNRLMEENEIRYFLDFGGMLGWIREKRFLPWDPDLDFSVLIDSPDTIERVRSALRAAGFKWRNEYLDERGRCAEDGYEMHGIAIDFFYYYRGKNSWRVSVFSITENGVDCDVRNAIQLSYVEPKGLREYTVGGVDVMMPVDAEAALSERYGVGWRQPAKKWSPDEGVQKIRVNLGPVGRFVRHCD